MASTPSSGAAEGELHQRFLDEAPVGWKKLEELSLNLHVIYKLRSDASSEGPAEPEEGQSEIKIRGDQKLVHHIGAAIEKVGVTTPQYSFGVNRNSSQDDWAVMYIGRPRDEFDWEIEETVNANASLLYALKGIPLSELVELPDVTLTSVTEANDEATGRSSVRVDYSCDNGELNFPTGKAPVKGGWFVLNPDQYWAVSEAGVQLPDATWRILVHGSVDDEGRPVVDTNEEIAEYNKGPNSGKKSSVAYEFASYEYKVVPEADFLPGTYGLPNPALVDTDQSSSRVWLILFGNVVILLGVAMYWYHRRSTKSSDSD
ncbi:MAG: hypothetical protein H6822_20595 [Planctomycetaceae bacterium]|nr:hypothetical protein [Planctomycetales bacterium]MCB9924590.1 hypothetical protein [Planctomycetaceae bacterium]